MTCLDDDAISALVAGSAAAAERARIETHLDTCASCRRLLSAIARANPGSEDARAAASATAPTSSGPPAPSAIERGTVLGRFIVLARAGVGAMGTIYAVYDPELDRKVALKVIDTGRDEDPAATRARLLREAQAMARVTHPNVVAVHDVGSLGDRVFFTMELVEAGSLRKWLAAAARPIGEILRVFVEAGRGLAAAHAADLVHRDFKPDNVLVGEDGRVRVGDFGLARGALEERGDGLAVDHRPTALAAATTQTGAVLGTPSYMSPEQHLGRRADARSDQYAFCVALYEALYGQLPFRGTGERPLEELRRQVLRGGVAFPAWPRLPRPVRRALARGLEVDPSARYRSMDELLAVFAVASAPPRRRWAALATGLFAAGIASLVSVRMHAKRAASCDAGEGSLARVWDPSQKRAIARAFAATQLPFADDAWRGVERTLDGYAGSWVSARGSACQAARLGPEPPDATLALRMVCLDRSLSELRALSELFAQADATVVEHAIEAARQLPPVSGCASPAGLVAQPAPPADPAVGRRVGALRERLDRIAALRRAGKYAAGLELARQASAEATTLDYRPVLAEVLYLEGCLREEVWDLTGAAERLLEAASTAEAAHHDRMAAAAWTRLVRVVGYRQAHHESGLLLARVAEAALRRAGEPLDLAAGFAGSLETLLYAMGRYREARPHAERARALCEQAFGRDDPRTATALDALEQLLERAGQYDQALVLAQDSLRVRVFAFGATHPEVARSLTNLSWIHLRAGHFADAFTYAQRALAVYQAALGPADPQLATALDPLGLALLGQGKPAAALPTLARALALEKGPHAQHPFVAQIQVHLGRAYAALGRHESARREIAQAYAMQRALLRPDHPSLGETLLALAEVLRQLGRSHQAVVHAARAVAIAQQDAAGEGPQVTRALVQLGRSQFSAGDIAGAVASLSRAMQRGHDGLNSVEQAELSFALCQALWNTSARCASAWLLPASTSQSRRRGPGRDAAPAAGRRLDSRELAVRSGDVRPWPRSCVLP